MIPNETSCGGYNIFDPPVSPRSQSFFFSLVSTTSLCSKEFRKTCSNERHTVYMRISTGNFDIIFIPGNYASFELRNLAKIKYSTETVCQRNSSETGQQNFVKLL